MQFFKSIRWAPGRATPSNGGVALRRFEDHGFKLLVRRHALSSHEHITLSSKSLSSCYTCAPITGHQFSEVVAERLIAPVLKIEFKISDPNGQIWTGLFWLADSSFQTVLNFSQQWTEVSPIFFLGYFCGLLAVKCFTGVYVWKKFDSDAAIAHVCIFAPRRVNNRISG